VGWDLNSVLPAEVEFAAAQQLLSTHGDDARFEKSINSWFTTADRNLFKGDASGSLRGLLSSPFPDVAAALAGDGLSIVILVAAIKRACRDLVLPSRPTLPASEEKLGCHPAVNGAGEKGKQAAALYPDSAQFDFFGGLQCGKVKTAADSSRDAVNLDMMIDGAEPEVEEPLCLDRVPERLWAGWCRNINFSRLDRFALGFFSRSLRNLPSRLWNVRISTYTKLSLEQVRCLGGYGPSAVLDVVKIVSDIGQTLDRLPRDSRSRVLIMPSAILDVSAWVSRVLQHERVPNTTSIIHGFIRPLLRQVDIDLGPQVAEMVERRAGLDGCPQTLDEIAHDFRLTRERIRQQTKRTISIFRTRWPEGRYLLDDFYDLLRGSRDAQEQVDLVRRVVDILFDFEYVRAVSHREIHEAWEKLGKQKRTPMIESEILSWLASEFPLVAPDIAFAWIKDHALIIDGTNGDSLYFTKTPHDRLLHELQTSRAPMTLADAAEIVEDDERNLRLQLERDPRFVEDEYMRILAAENCSFVRVDGYWHIRVHASKSGESQRSESICLDNLGQLICTGLLELGVSDATVWGAQRYANKTLGQMRYGGLPPDVSPFVLASKLVAHSDGVIRVMRRRRLRWDGGEGVPPARGKLGWIGYVVRQAAMPMTMRELDSALRAFYQDYEWYVLSQVSLDDEEDGEHFCGARIVPGYSNYLPAIVLPCDWKLDLALENVSEEIKLLVAKIIAAGKKGKYPKKVLEDTPWLGELVDRHSYGRMKWSDEKPPRGNAKNGPVIDDVPLEENMPTQTDGGMIRRTSQVKVVDRIENLLSRLF
jgi:hypothetical protein